MKKSTVAILMILILIFSVSCSLFTGAKPAIPKSLSLSGTAVNTTADVSSGVAFTVRSDDSSTFSAQGAFDSVNLFGRFEATGYPTECENSDNTCIEFSGDLYLGDDGSGFDSGTVTSYLMTLVFDEENNATGTYVVGVIPPDMDFEQFGTLVLFSE